LRCRAMSSGWGQGRSCSEAARCSVAAPSEPDSSV
jgi:hypothetical protein